MRLRYQDPDNKVMILEWRKRSEGVELVITGPGFDPVGFSIGIYSPQALQDVLGRFTDQQPEPESKWMRWPVLYEPLYSFTKPTRFVAQQGNKTRLAIHAEAWKDHGFDWPFRSPRTATIHEQGERTPWRWMGRYRFWDVCAFLNHGISLALAQAA